MKKRLLTFLSIALLGGVNSWAQAGSDLASKIQSAESGGTVQLTADVNLTSTVTINKNLTLDLNGHSITATNCRAFHVTAGDVTIQNTSTKVTTAQISSVKTEGDESFTVSHSVIRVGDNNGTDVTEVKLTIEKGVKVTTPYCYGVSVFGNKTTETLVVNGEVSYTGEAGVPAIAGNGMAAYKGTTITIGATGVVTAKNENAIYHPQDGTLTVYGTVGATDGGGIEAKAGTIKIFDGAKVIGQSDTANLKFKSNSNGCSSNGYAIAVVNHNSYDGNKGANVTINNTSGYANGTIAILNDIVDENTVKGTVKIERGYFENFDPTPFVVDGKYIAKDFGTSYTVLDSENDVVAKIGNSKYGALGNAFRQWNKTRGQTNLTLIKDTESTAYKLMEIGDDLTFDLNGYKWTYTGSEKTYSLRVPQGAKLTINDSSAGKTGSIVNHVKNGLVVYVGTISNPGEGQVATLVVNGGKFDGQDFAISGNGTLHGTDVTINGGEFSALVPVYHPQKGKLTINGGKFTGSETGVELRSGELNVTGGEFTSTATPAEVNSNGNGSTSYGYALAISQHTTKNDIKATISGGTFKAYSGFGVVNPQNNDTKNVDVTISGGKFTSTGENGYALVMTHQKGKLNVISGTFEGKINALEGATKLLGGTYSEKPDDKLVATEMTNEDGKYQILSGFAKTIRDAQAGSTITLDDDIILSNTVKIGKDLTIDLNGHNIKATDCRAFHIVAGDVTIKNSVTNKTAQVRADKTSDDSAFPDNQSVIRVGDNNGTAGTEVKLTIGEKVQVYTTHCYGISVFGNKTKETLVVNGDVKYAGTEGVPAISGNGSEGYEGTEIIIGPTGTVNAKNENAIYHPQDGTLKVYGTIGLYSQGGIEAKAGTIEILEGAKIFGAKTVSHNANSNGCSTKGYAIAVVNNKNYSKKNPGAKVTIDNPTGSISRTIGIVDDDNDTSNNHGSIVIKHGYFEYFDPTPFAADGQYVARGYYSSTPANWVFDSKDDVVATVGEYEFGLIGKAIAAWTDGKTLTLNKDVEYTTYKQFKSGSLTLDLNGHKWTYTGIKNYPFQVCNGGTFTINDSSEGKTGSIENKYEGASVIVFVGSSTTDNSKVAKLVVNGGKLKCEKYYSISGNGTYNNTDITINGGEFEAQVPVYHPQKGKLTINGGKFTGSQVGIELRSGELNITGGEFESTAAAASVNPNGSGTTTSGYALGISQHATKHDINATISGGTFKGVKAVGVVNPQNNETKNVNVTIVGGKFNGEIQAEYGKTKLLGGTYSVQPAEALIAQDFFAKTVEGGFEVAYKEVSAAVPDNTQLKDENGQDIAQEKAEAVKDAVTETVTNNDAVNNVEPNTEEAINKEATSADGKTLDQKIEEAVKAADGNYKAEDITTTKASVSIELKSAAVKTTEVDQTTTALVTKMVFDIKPVVAAFVGSEKVAQVEVPNDLIKQKIKFRLPIDKNAPNTYVQVGHTPDGAQVEENLGLFAVLTDNGNKYIELERDQFSQYSVTLSNATSTMKAYLGNSNEVTIAMDKDAWEKELATNPNAIAIVSADNATFAGSTKNVLIEYTYGKIGKSYECPNFVLTDLKDFYTPVNFTALSGSYARTSFSSGDESVKYFSSVCLPFALTGEMLSNTAETFIFTAIENETTVKFSQRKQMSAGMPCIVRDINGTEWNVTFQNTEIVASPIDDVNMKGTFVKTDKYGKEANSGTTKFFSVDANNQFSPLASTLSPFRACLDFNSDEEFDIKDGESQSRILNIVIEGEDDEATGIDTVKDNAASSTGVYTLNGAKVATNTNKLPKGIYIRNGKKVVIK